MADIGGAGHITDRKVKETETLRTGAHRAFETADIGERLS